MRTPTGSAVQSRCSVGVGLRGGLRPPVDRAADRATLRQRNHPNRPEIQQGRQDSNPSWDDYAGEITPKSAKGTRTVPLTALLRRDHLVALKATTGRDGSDFVFGAAADRPSTPSHIRRQAAKGVGGRQQAARGAEQTAKREFGHRVAADPLYAGLLIDEAHPVTGEAFQACRNHRLGGSVRRLVAGYSGDEDVPLERIQHDVRGCPHGGGPRNLA
jgi:hypothetical protein